LLDRARMQALEVICVVGLFTTIYHVSRHLYILTIRKA
jgi:hypothetical protein